MRGAMMAPASGSARGGARVVAALLVAWAVQRKLQLRERLSRALHVGAADGPTPLLVRVGPQLAALLGVVSLALLERSRRLERDEAEERAWVEGELEKRKDKLRGILALARESLEEAKRKAKAGEDKENVDAGVVLVAADDVAELRRGEATVAESLMLASEILAHNLALVGDLQPESQAVVTEDGAHQVAPDEASKVVDLLELEEDILSKARAYAVDEGPIKAALSDSTSRARHFVRVRRANQMRKLISLLDRAKSQLPYFAISGVLSVVSGSIFALKTHYMNRVMTLAYEGLSSGQDGKAQGSIAATVRVLLNLELLSLLSSFVGDKIKSMGQDEFVTTLQTELFRSLIAQDMEYFDKADVHEARGTIGACAKVCSELFDLPINTLQNLSSMLATLSFMLGKSRPLSLVLAVLLPLRLGLNQALTDGEDRLDASMGLPHSSNMRGTWMMLVNSAAFRTMRSFGREPVETAVFSQALKARNRCRAQSSLLFRVFDIARTLVDTSVDIGALWYGGRLASQGKMEVSDIATFTNTASHALERGRSIYYALNEFVDHDGTLDSVEKIYDLLHAKPRIGIDEPPLSTMPADPAALSWGLAFDKVSFAYTGREKAPALVDVSFSVAEGERVGILGESGCGKSTLVALVARLYDPHEGVVSVAGRPISQFNPLWLRARIAVVSQAIYLPLRTVKENLLYGMARSDEDLAGPEVEQTLRAALRMARCEDLFFDKTRFPHEWHTDIGRNGSKLSGGERQRLCIARAILSKPRILVLDEATSALDEESQFRVQEAIQNLYEASGRRLTILTVAHRLSNFRHVDRLLVLEKGRIVQQGTPSELVADAGGIFANFVDRSTLSFGDGADAPQEQLSEKQE